MNPPIVLQDYVAELVHSYPSAELQFRPLPSGVCFLWITLLERNFVLEYDPKRGVGVSENLPTTPPFVGHDEAYPNLEDGLKKLRSLLRDAAQTIPAVFQAA
ncbi:MAG TPA: hypothetical protein VGO11_07770 [Chthoniobacteraceae bacterium]|jgi:hypothetical protein|nr:hypothetical protein [Chthoniobacteraceae bacterium]